MGGEEVRRAYWKVKWLIFVSLIHGREDWELRYETASRLERASGHVGSWLYFNFYHIFIQVIAIITEGPRSLFSLVDSVHNPTVLIWQNRAICSPAYTAPECTVQGSEPSSVCQSCQLCATRGNIKLIVQKVWHEAGNFSLGNLRVHSLLPVTFKKHLFYKFCKNDWIHFFVYPA